MTAPFNYPTSPKSRKHGPDGYATYESYRPWLRDEFTFRCVFCLTRETWGPFRAQFAIDHFVPAKTRRDDPAEYENLLYTCVTCNASKGDRPVSDPLVTLHEGSIRIDRDGTLRAETVEAAETIELLDLNHPRKLEFRSLWIAVVAMSERVDPELYRRIVCFPDDLPDLTNLSPPNGNTRPEGIADSFHSRRLRGELPATY